MMDLDSIFEEGYRLYLEAESQDDLEKARMSLGQAASEGHAMAQDILGNMYEDGDGVEEDIATALQLYRKSAEQDCSFGLYDLGMLYLEGKGVEKDAERAFALIDKAVSLDSQPYHVYMLSILYHKGEGVAQDEKRAMELLEKAVELGCSEAKANLGAVLLSGDGVEKDPGRAFVLLKEASEDQEAGAMCNLGLMYEGGILVEKDLAAAVSYYRQASDLGYAPAFYHLAILAGQGSVPVSLIDPSDLLKAGERVGNPGDVSSLGEAYYFGDGIEPDLELAVQYFRAGVDLDIPSCMYNLGIMIIRDEAAAEYDGEQYDLILAAADAGYGPAKELLEQAQEEQACSSP